MKKLILLLILALPAVSLAGGIITEIEPNGRMHTWTVTDFGPNNRTILDIDTGKIINEYRTPDYFNDDLQLRVRESRSDSLLSPLPSLGDDE